MQHFCRSNWQQHQKHGSTCLGQVLPLILYSVFHMAGTDHRRFRIGQFPGCRLAWLLLFLFHALPSLGLVCAKKKIPFPFINGSCTGGPHTKKRCSVGSTVFYYLPAVFFRRSKIANRAAPSTGASAPSAVCSTVSSREMMSMQFSFTCSRTISTISGKV